MSDEVRWSSADIQKRYGVKPDTVSAWVNRNKNPLPCLKLSGPFGPSTFIPSDVYEWEERCRLIRDGGASTTNRKWTRPPQPKQAGKRRGGHSGSPVELSSHAQADAR